MINQVTLNRFFNILDNEVFRREGKPQPRMMIIQERHLSYSLTLHQHPYVQALTQQLLRKGTSGLQAADTEYVTRVTLTASASATDSSGHAVPLGAGERVALSDGTTALVDGTPVRFVGNKVLGMLDNLPLVVPGDAHVTVGANATVRQSSGRTVTLGAETAVQLLDGRPVPVLFDEVFSATRYAPSGAVSTPYPVKELDFSSSGAYAVYNWELFYHVPLTIAQHLSKNNRFAEAQRWFQYLFDPTDDSAGPTPERFWKVKPFQTIAVRTIEDLLVNLATGTDAKLRRDTLRSLDAWKANPFRPHAVARIRQQAYMYKTVMASLDNLIAWGDSLFQQDTGEAIDEAMQLYVLAANILGPRPLPVPSKGRLRPQNYANLRQDLREFGTVQRELEVAMDFDLMPFPADAAAGAPQMASLRSLGKALYFCVPRNDKLLGYWDTVADRLFKIRNSLNFKGVFRQLALFEPPIDPALLARAAAAGLDVGAIVNGLNQPLPQVRFALLVQKAMEITQEVKSLGANLLSAMEKEDGEALALLRARHEGVILQMVEQVKYAQLQEAVKTREGLLQGLALAVQRYVYYEKQLGKTAAEIAQAIPELDDLDLDSLGKLTFAMQEPSLGLRDIAVDISQDLSESGGKIVSSFERAEFLGLKYAQESQQEAAALSLVAKFLALIPDFHGEVQPLGVGAAIQFGGHALSTELGMAADALNADASRSAYGASKAARIGGNARREQDWAYQSNLAAGEINQVFKQVRAAQIRQAIAEQELKNHRQQMRQAEEVETFLNAEGANRAGKTSNRAMYSWMKREVKGLYAQCFQFAFEIARKAERALQHELGDQTLTFMQFGYLSGKEGLLAGERLALDLKRMELAYHELNQREYELTRHVSLLQLDPLALIRLRRTGHCTFRLPEELFDMDGAGQYFRRVRSVALSVPCVLGPYVSAACKLTLLKNSIRTKPVVGDDYAQRDEDDIRFDASHSSLQSVVTSSAQNDSGLFETGGRDERLLPFEYAGAISEWQLELPADRTKGDLTLFDYDTISDVILHLRFTAREGGAALRKAAITHLKESVAQSAMGAVRLFNVRQEFPSEWARFTAGAGQPADLTLNFRPEHYPYWSAPWLDQVVQLQVIAAGPQATALKVTPMPGGEEVALVSQPELGGASAVLNPGAFKKPTDSLTLHFTDNGLENLWIAVTWGKPAAP